MTVDFASFLRGKSESQYSRFLELKNEIDISEADINNLHWYINNFEESDRFPILVYLVEKIFHNFGYKYNLDVFKNIKYFSEYNLIPANLNSLGQLELLFLAIKGFLNKDLIVLTSNDTELKQIKDKYSRLNLFYKENILKFYTLHQYFYNKFNENYSNYDIYITNVHNFSTKFAMAEISLKVYNPYNLSQKPYTTLIRPSKIESIKNLYGFYFYEQNFKKTLPYLKIMRCEFVKNEFTLNLLVDNVKKIYVTNSESFYKEIIKPLSIEMKIIDYSTYNISNIISNFLKPQTGSIYVISNEHIITLMRLFDFNNLNIDIIYVLSPGLEWVNLKSSYLLSDGIFTESKKLNSLLKKSESLAYVGSNEQNIAVKEYKTEKNIIEDICKYPINVENFKPEFDYAFYDSVASSTQEALELIYKDIKLYVKKLITSELYSDFSKDFYSKDELFSVESLCRNKYAIDTNLTYLLKNGRVDRMRLISSIKLKIYLKVFKTNISNVLKYEAYNNELYLLHKLNISLNMNANMASEVRQTLLAKERDLFRNKTIKLFVSNYS